MLSFIVARHIRNDGSCDDAHMFGIGLREASRAIGYSTDQANRVLSELESLEIIEKNNNDGKWYRRI